MRRMLSTAAATMFIMMALSCNSNNPIVADHTSSKTIGDIAWMGMGSGTAPLNVSWTDCDGNLVTGTFDLHYVFGWDYDTPPDHGLKLNTSWNARGTCTSVDGTEYNYIDNGGFRDYSEAIDECTVGHNGWQRILVTTKGSGKVYFLKYHYWFTYNTCTGETTLKINDWKIECD